MDEVLPSVFHWSAFHERIRQDVHSYWLPGSATLIDPMLPDAVLERLRTGRAPERIIVSNRHHWRHSARAVEEFGCSVHCHEAGLHEFADGRAVEGFSFGDEVAAGVRALELDAICAEDTALRIETPHGGALAFADGLIRAPDGSLSFVADRLMGDDPEEVKRGLRRALGRLADEADFDHLLFAHGPPLVGGGGRQALRRFVDAGAAT